MLAIHRPFIEFSQDIYFLFYIITRPSKWVSQGLFFCLTSYPSGACGSAGASAGNQRTFLKKWPALNIYVIRIITNVEDFTSFVGFEELFYHPKSTCSGFTHIYHYRPWLYIISLGNVMSWCSAWWINHHFGMSSQSCSVSASLTNHAKCMFWVSESLSKHRMDCKCQGRKVW